jgi:hypothetical protein
MMFVRRSLLLLFLLLPAISPSLWAQQDSAASVLPGISNDGKNQKEPYGTAGDRSYLIGT